jgi:hypothetical protein
MRDLEKDCKLRANFLDPLNHVGQRSRNRNQSGLTLEDYFEGHADIHIHYVLRVGNSERREICAVLQWINAEKKLTIEDGISVIHRLCGDSVAIGDGQSRDEELMLVHIVEIIKGTESVSVPAQGVVKRLQPFKDCKDFTTNPDRKAFLAVESAGDSEYRELCTGGVPVNPGRIISHDQRPKKVIERRPCVLEAITNEQGQAFNIRGREEVEPKHVDTRLLIGLLNDRVRFSFSDRSRNSAIQSVKVFLCPSDLCEKSSGQISYSLPPWYGEE